MRNIEAIHLLEGAILGIKMVLSRADLTTEKRQKLEATTEELSATLKTLKEEGIKVLVDNVYFCLPEIIELARTIFGETEGLRIFERELNYRALKLRHIQKNDGNLA